MEYKTQPYERYNLTKDEFEQLKDKSIEALELSYSPYSKFRVGCVILTTNGKYIKGSNIENASYGAGICAERSTICTALNQNESNFKALAISSDLKMNEIISPCGICRQFIREFSQKLPILMFNKFYDQNQNDDNYNLYYRIQTLDELLPLSFGPEHLI